LEAGATTEVDESHRTDGTGAEEETSAKVALFGQFLAPALLDEFLKHSAACNDNGSSDSSSNGLLVLWEFRAFILSSNSTAFPLQQFACVDEARAFLLLHGRSMHAAWARAGRTQEEKAAVRRLFRFFDVDIDGLRDEPDGMTEEDEEDEPFPPPRAPSGRKRGPPNRYAVEYADDKTTKGITFSNPPMANGSSSNGNGTYNHTAKVAGEDGTPLPLPWVDESGEIYGEDDFPSPASFSVASSIHSAIENMNERLNDLTKWQYRLLCGGLWFTLLLALLLGVSIVYGFGLKYVHFSVTGTTPLVPTLADTQGNVRLRATLSLDNPNIFPIAAAPTTTTVSCVDRTNGTLYPLVTAPVPRIYLHAREEGHVIHSDLILKDLGKLTGGPELMTAALKGKVAFLHSTTTLRLHVKALGFVPIVRVFQVDCYIATLCGEPTRPDGSKETVSDCMGTFL